MQIDVKNQKPIMQIDAKKVVRAVLPVVVGSNIMAAS